MNSAMNQQSKQSLSVDPSVKVKDIQAKTRVSVYLLKHHNIKHWEKYLEYSNFKMEIPICVNKIGKMLKTAWFVQWIGIVAIVKLDPKKLII